VVEGHLEQNAKNIEHRTEALIARAQQRLAQYRAGVLAAKIQKEWQSGRRPVGEASFYRA
jgi:hypothetical protein